MAIVYCSFSDGRFDGGANLPSVRVREGKAEVDQRVADSLVLEFPGYFSKRPLNPDQVQQTEYVDPDEPVAPAQSRSRAAKDPVAEVPTDPKGEEE
jgi:hypothetical protein